MFLSDSLSLMVVSVRLSLACFSSLSFSFNEFSVAARAASAASRLDLWKEAKLELFHCLHNLILSISAWASTKASKASARLRFFMVVLGDPLSLVAMPLSSFCTPER